MPQAEKPSTTRRALFAAAPALALSATPALAQDSCVAEIAAWQAAEDHYNATDYFDDVEGDAELKPLVEWETRIFLRPCTSIGDAYAKCYMVAQLFEKGDRTDKADETAMAAVINFLRSVA